MWCAIQCVCCQFRVCAVQWPLHLTAPPRPVCHDPEYAGFERLGQANRLVQSCWFGCSGTNIAPASWVLRGNDAYRQTAGLAFRTNWQLGCFLHRSTDPLPIAPFAPSRSVSFRPSRPAEIWALIANKFVMWSSSSHFWRNETYVQVWSVLCKFQHHHFQKSFAGWQHSGRFCAK